MEVVATDAPPLMAMEVLTDSCRHLPKRFLKRPVADIINFASDDQATPRVDQNSANIAQSFEIFVYEITNDAALLMAMAVATESRRRLPKRSRKRHAADVKKHHQ